MTEITVLTLYDVVLNDFNLTMHANKLYECFKYSFMHSQHKIYINTNDLAGLYRIRRGPFGL